MIVGTLKEIKNNEFRVGLTPASVQELCRDGHEVWVEHNAGRGINAPDHAYEAVGARIARNADELFQKAQLIVKVKEPQAEECARLTADHTLFTFLHLAADRAQTEALLASRCTAVAYETVRDKEGRLPLLTPMSEVAGRLSLQAAMHYLQKPLGGSGIVLGGVPGTSPGNVVVIGGGVAGTEAITMAMGAGARTTIIDRSLDRLRALKNQFGLQLTTLYINDAGIPAAIRNADVVVGAVLVPGAAAPRVLTRDMLRTMKPGSVVIDLAIDQGGCFETSRPTTQADPIYVEENIIHYCVTNVPGAVPVTSTAALTNVTLPYTLQLAQKGTKEALLANPFFLEGLNIHQGHLTCREVAEAFDMPYLSPLEALA